MDERFDKTVSRTKAATGLMSASRRSVLKGSLIWGGRAVLPPGVFALVGCSGTAADEFTVGVDGKIMGTGYSVRVAREDLPGTGKTLADVALRVYQALQHVDALMSSWRTDSEVTLFNASSEDDWYPMTPATIQVVDQALQTSAISKGAFDISVGPLVDLWGFGANTVSPAGMNSNSGVLGSRPSSDAINSTLVNIGYGALEVDVSNNALRKRNRNTQLDLSGIAKGYAVDSVCNVLNNLGVQRYMVEVGGELRAKGYKPNGDAWRVAIEQPLVQRSREAFRVLPLVNRAIATSGDYRHFFIEGGQRFSHSIDPRTGEPVSHALASVTVVAHTATTADALSTALMVSGPEIAIELAEQNHIAACLILKAGETLEQVTSSAFDTLFTV